MDHGAHVARADAAYVITYPELGVDRVTAGLTQGLHQITRLRDVDQGIIGRVPDPHRHVFDRRGRGSSFPSPSNPV